MAFLRQAQDFHRASIDAANAAARPLLLYYSFLNVAKALMLANRSLQKLDRAQHGLSENFSSQGPKLSSAHLDAFPTSARSVNIFDELLNTLNGARLVSKRRFHLRSLLPQVVAGHRLLVDATGGSERFLAVEKPEYLHDVGGDAWVRLEFPRGDLQRLGQSQSDLIKQGRHCNLFRFVQCDADSHLWMETKAKANHGGSWVQNAVRDMADLVRPVFWQTVLAVPPFRRFYLYISPRYETKRVVPQIASIYAIMYYLGSITRYRPHSFEQLAGSEYGPFIQAFLNDQPAQFLYLMASEFAKREVVKAALV